MKDVYVEAFNNQTFKQDGNENAILKTKHYNSHGLIFQYLPPKENVEKIEVNKIRSG